MNLVDKVNQDTIKAAMWLLFTDERKKAYIQQREEYLHSYRPGSFIPVDNPGSLTATEAKAVKMLELQEMEAWVNLIAEIESSLPENQRAFLVLRRKYRNFRGHRGRRGWIAQVQEKYSEETGTWIESGKTFTKWWKRIVQITVVTAAKRGLL